MKPRTKPHPVQFYVTSSRVIRVVRNAVRHNKSLSRLAGVHDLTQPASAPSVHHPEETRVVVLSHADEFPPFRETAFPTGFHFLFTDRETHPDQVHQWMSRTGIRSETRLHVLKLECLTEPHVSQLLGRLCQALRPGTQQSGIIDAYVSGETLHVRGPENRLLHVPLKEIPALKGGALEALTGFELDPDGSFLYWPEWDVHLGWDQFLQLTDPEVFRKAQQRTDGFNRRYGASIRRVREEHGIPQSRIDGLTERQVRRIELGECRATSTALGHLAAAHRMELNEYLERLAAIMSATDGVPSRLPS